MGVIFIEEGFGDILVSLWCAALLIVIRNKQKNQR